MEKISIKNSIIILLAGAVIWIIYDAYWIYHRFTITWKYFKTHTVENIFAFVPLFVAISVIIFCITLLNNNPDQVFDEEEEAIL